MWRIRKRKVQKGLSFFLLPLSSWFIAFPRNDVISYYFKTTQTTALQLYCLLCCTHCKSVWISISYMTTSVKRFSVKTTAALRGNRQRGEYSTVGRRVCVREPGTSSTCSASSTTAACFSLLPPSVPPPPLLIHIPFLRPTVAFLPAPSSRRWASCAPLFPPRRRAALTDAGFF